MTFDEIVQEVMDRLNLTSTDARTRIGKHVNKRYKWVTSGIGLDTSRKIYKNVTVNPLTPGLPELVIEDMQKIDKITFTDESGGIRILKNMTYDEITNLSPVVGTPRAWATKRMGSTSVTIRFDGTVAPNEPAFVIGVLGYELAPTLADDVEPAFPQDFHDVLTEGARSDELKKMEKPSIAAEAEALYAQRLSDLRYFISKSTYLDIYQGKDKPSTQWYRPWFSRVSVSES